VKLCICEVGVSTPNTVRADPLREVNYVSRATNLVQCRSPLKWPETLSWLQWLCWPALLQTAGGSEDQNSGTSQTQGHQHQRWEKSIAWILTSEYWHPETLWHTQGPHLLSKCCFMGIEKLRLSHKTRVRPVWKSWIT